MIPGFATIKRDLAPALTLGVNVVRVATHCTEADISLRYIEFVRKQGATAYGVLMMSHMASPSELARQARLMESAGAESVILMDSAGYFLPTDVKDRIAMLAVALGIPVGFHAHNNLGLAIANSLAAVEAGATMIDGTARGFGAGAGNAALEQLVPVLSRYGYDTGIDLYGVLDVADYAAADLAREAPNTTSIGIISSLAGVFSGFATPVLRAARETGVDPRQIIAELGRRKILAGQEDSIVEVAIELSKNTNPNVSIPAMVNDNPVSNTNLRP
jgi:4-hydroxy 2-oxovalerate aldolase